MLRATSVATGIIYAMQPNNNDTIKLNMLCSEDKIMIKKTCGF